MPRHPLPDPTSSLLRLLGTLRGVVIAVFLFSTLLGFNALQMGSLLFRPISRSVFRAVNRWSANTWWSLCVLTARLLYGTRIKITGDALPSREIVILLANHQQMSDVTYLMFLGQAKQRLGDMKWFVKDVVKWVPGVGWGMLFLDCLFVKRNWASDAASIKRTFSRILKDRVPLWLILFPEGTRILPEKLQKNQRRCKRRGQPLLYHLLAPKTNGFAASVIGLRNHLHAVYDVTIAYAEGVPSLWQYVKGYSRVAHLHVRRYAVEDLPEADDALANWLWQRWQEKDQLLEQFYLTGAFPPGSSR